MEQESLLFEKKLSNGYYKIKVNNVWMFEHTWIVQDFLGRNLNEDERIHHINGIKTDNHIENLALFTKSQHSHFHRQILQHGYTTPRRLTIFNNPIQVKLREQNEA